MSCLRAMLASSAALLLGCGGWRLLQQPVQRVRGLSALALPVVESRAVDRERASRVERSDVLDEAPVPGLPVIRDDNAVKSSLLGTMTGQANVNGHTFL